MSLLEIMRPTGVGCCTAIGFRWVAAVLIMFIVSFPSVAQRVVLPEPVTNNAVVALERDGRTFFYSFFGLDSTRKQPGVHSKVIRVDLQTGRSAVIGKVPDAGRLASGASAIANKAYVAGGYEVMKSGKEKSSRHLFIFDPSVEKFTAGASLPVPVDDHAQAVWKNKLLFVIGGWSDSLNVSAVQVYDPASDGWKLATSLPDESGAKVFGGSGVIAGDTIYFLGGATFAKYYPPSRSFYKGAVNPLNPYQITWISCGTYPGEFRYRSAAVQVNDKIYFIGGSSDTYNYDGISYAQKKKTEPNTTILVYTIATGKFSTQPSDQAVMDLRGVVKDKAGNVFTLGGMERAQHVSKEVKRIAGVGL